MAESWTFTADSENQRELAKKLQENAQSFNEKVGKVYDEIGGMGSNGYWVGEDYDAFKTGTDGYRGALTDLSRSINMFGDHFNRVADGTDKLAPELINIIENSLANVTTTVASNDYALGPGNIPETEQPTTTPGFWDIVGGRYAFDWNDYVEDFKERWGDANGLFSSIGALALTAFESVYLINDMAIDTAQFAVDGVDWCGNWLFDIGTGRGGSTTDEYWANIGNDYAENFDYSNVDNFFEGAGVTVTGLFRSAADVGQTVLNGLTSAVDWVGDSVTSLMDKGGDALGGIIDFIF